MNKRTTPTAFRLTATGRALMEALAEKHGVSNTAIVEMALREKAERDKVTAKDAKEEYTD